jgi:hypothetical protein
MEGGAVQRGGELVARQNNVRLACGAWVLVSAPAFLRIPYKQCSLDLPVQAG